MSRVPQGPRLLRLAISSIVTLVIITAIELTIVWNNLSGVNNLSSAGQMIPLIIGAIILLRVIYVRFSGLNEIETSIYINPPWLASASSSAEFVIDD